MGGDVNHKTVRSVERTLNILFLIAKSPDPMSLAEIHSASGVDKATALRLLGTLETFKLITRDEKTRGYTVGSAVWQLASFYQTELKTVAEPHLRVLQDLTGESVSLVVPRGLERVVLVALEASHELRIVPVVNSVTPIYSGASGKVLMAYMTEAERDRIIELTQLRPVNERSVTDRGTFLETLKQVRHDGFSASFGDVTLGAVAVAAPVLRADGVASAAVSLRAPEARLTEERVDNIAPLVVEAATRISRDWAGMQAAQAAV
jgi:DNA-binding IclR family transcriptional regulator